MLCPRMIKAPVRGRGPHLHPIRHREGEGGLLALRHHVGDLLQVLRPGRGREPEDRERQAQPACEKHQTTDQDTRRSGRPFARTYRAVSPGLYEKVAPVWAEIAEHPGQITTKEGVTHYNAGAYLVYNEPDGKDGYAVDAKAFEKMYEPATEPEI